MAHKLLLSGRSARSSIARSALLAYAAEMGNLSGDAHRMVSRAGCESSTMTPKKEGLAMLGDKIGEESGKVIGTRILPGEGGRYIKMEVTIQTKGTYLGQKGTDMGTYVAYERVPGQVYGEGQGIFMTDDGEGVIWNGMGVGTPTGEGMGMKWSAAVTYQTNSKKLARLNGIVGMVEHETDAKGNAKVKAWEWKAAK